MELQTIPDVELVSTGTYSLASGVTTFTAEDLAAAVQAAQDPTIPAPRLKLGHDDPRFDEAIASGELSGEPAFGQVANMRLSEDGQTIIGDYVNVPDWLADTMPSSYPGRSIEGGFGFQAASGRTYDFVIADVALLGVTWPGVSCLADLQSVLTAANGNVERFDFADDAQFAYAAGSGERFVTARIALPREEGPTPSGTVAGMDMGMVQRAFIDDLEEGDIDVSGLEDCGPCLWWWPRSVRVEDGGDLVLIVDDDAGHLIRVPFTVNGAELDYGSPEVVMETFVPVPSGTSASGPRVLASWAGNSVRAARSSTTPQEAETMDIDAGVLRARLGLAEDASEDDIQAALAAEPAPGKAPVAPVVPEGMALIDEGTLAELRTGAEAGITASTRFANQDRDAVITAAIEAGKMPPARREHFEALWGRDAEGTRTLLTASQAEGGLAPGLIPLDGREMGRAGDGDADPAADVATHESIRARHFPELAQRERTEA